MISIDITELIRAIEQKLNNKVLKFMPLVLEDKMNNKIPMDLHYKLLCTSEDCKNGTEYVNVTIEKISKGTAQVGIKGRNRSSSKLRTREIIKFM